VNFGPGVPRYHAATCISPSLMHLYNCLSVMLSTKLTKFSSRYLLHRLSEQDEIWHTDRSGLAVHLFQDW